MLLFLAAHPGIIGGPHRCQGCAPSARMAQPRRSRPLLRCDPRQLWVGCPSLLLPLLLLLLLLLLLAPMRAQPARGALAARVPRTDGGRSRAHRCDHPARRSRSERGTMREGRSAPPQPGPMRATRSVAGPGKRQHGTCHNAPPWRVTCGHRAGAPPHGRDCVGDGVERSESVSPCTPFAAFDAGSRPGSPAWTR